MSGLPRNFFECASSFMEPMVDRLYEKVCGCTDSPIEAAFATAFLTIGRIHGIGVDFVDRGAALGLDNSKDFYIAPQRQIGSYRADFIIGCTPVDTALQIVVECDGHAFHERTKEQAAHDKARDRRMQGVGYKVFRFTGHEIYRNAFDCAGEAFVALYDLRETAKR